MKTFRITENEIKGLKPVAVGYKIFRNDWTSKSNGYDYKDENGNVLNTIHKVDGDISECRWGLHFSKEPIDCFKFYGTIPWYKFAKVEAYDQLLIGEEKCVTNILKIVEIYTFDEFINLIQEDLQNNVPNGVNESYGVNWSNGVNSSYGVDWSNGVNSSYGVSSSYGMSLSKGVNVSDGVNKSNGVNVSYGVSESNGVNRSYGILECEGISRAIFCYKKSGKLMAFNKRITEERFNEIFAELNSFGWYPKFNNAEQLKGDLEWYETNIPAIKSVDNKTAWGSMPEEMLNYIKSLPEYDEQIFNKITGGEL